MNDYGLKQYWDERYVAEKGKTYDWLVDYEQLKCILSKCPQQVQKCSKILNVGCGNGVITEEMYDDGYKSITNIDISEEVIQQMQDRNTKRLEMRYLVMDGQEMIFEDESFDVVLDKCTIDGIMTSEEYLLTAHRVISEVFRVLKTGGLYIVVSYASSSTRRYLFERKSTQFTIAEQSTTKDGK